MSFLSKAAGFVKKGLGFTPFTGFGALKSITGYGPGGPSTDLLNKAGSVAGITTPGQSAENKTASANEAAQIAAARKAAHDAEVAQLAEGALGAVGLRRRRGSYATRLTGSPGMGGASPGSTGKTMLGQ
jgi:hypothetical protein